MAGEVVLADPDLIDPELVAELDFFHDRLDALPGRRVLMPANNLELAEFHSWSPLCRRVLRVLIIRRGGNGVEPMVVRR